jgi:hypothetical protein
MNRTAAVLLALFARALALAGYAVTYADYRDYHDYLVSGTPIYVVVADVNNDGIPDVIAGTSGGVDVMLGRHDGSLRPPVLASDAAVWSLVVADFNNDGKPDIGIANLTLSDSYFSLALGNGDGTFQAPVKVPIKCHTCAMAVADFNGDGNLDLATADSGEVTVFLGDGKGGFTGGLPIYSMRFATAIATADLNGDGKPDLVVAHDRALMVLLGNGNGSFAATKYGNGYSAYGLVLADFNGDGLPDVAVADGQSTKITVRLNQGGGVLGAPTAYETGCTNCNLQSIASGDFNRDGNIDLATPLSILYGNGEGTFQAPKGFTAGEGSDRVAAGDINGDGYSDLVVGNGDTTDISVLLGNAKLVEQPPEIPAGGGPRAFVIADFNGDGIQDIAVADTGSNRVSILLGRSDGTFRQGKHYSSDEPGALVAADFNGDGKIDLAVTGESGTTIFLGNGDGTLTAGAQYSLFGDCTNNQWPAHSCFVTADFNNDGIPDLAGALWIGDEVSILLGNGDGTFRTGPTIALGDTPTGLASGDFNHDGNIDLALTSYTGTIQVLPGNGDGTFGTPTVIQLEYGGLGGLAVGDLNGDGNPDIVVAGGGGSSFVSLGVYVFTGNGDLTFNPPVTFVTDEMPNWVLLADLNGDGRLDIVTADIMAENVGVLWNMGDLNFAPAELYGTGYSPAMVAAIAQGKSSALATLNQGGNITVLRPR